MNKLCILLLLGNICFSQSNSKSISNITKESFETDAIIRTPNLEFNKQIKIKQIDKSTSEVDIRFYSHYSLSNTKSLRRIYLDKEVWKIIEYDEWNNPKKIHKSELTPKVSLDTLYSKLLLHNILILPDQSELASKMHKPLELSEDGDGTMVERRISVMDGVGYTVEIKIGNKIRIFQFQNPESYSKFYDNVSELKDFATIAEVFKNDLVISNSR
jgi:hypothetical protein